MTLVIASMFGERIFCSGVVHHSNTEHNELIFTEDLNTFRIKLQIHIHV